MLFCRLTEESLLKHGDIISTILYIQLEGILVWIKNKKSYANF